MSDVAPGAGGGVVPGAGPASSDQLLQGTCESIVTMIANTIDSEPPGSSVLLKLPDGTLIGKQITIDATGPGGSGLLNLCRMSIFNVDVAPGEEAARVEFEHDKKGKFGLQRVYSIQSVRRRLGKLILLENFLASTPETVREEDFQPIRSESYAQTTVHATVKEWAHFRAWQLQEMRGK